MTAATVEIIETPIRHPRWARIPCVGCRKWIQLGRDGHHFNTHCVSCDATSLGTTEAEQRKKRTIEARS